MCGLDVIDGYELIKPLSGGKASATLLYQGSNNKKVVIKMLIAPRNQHELEFFRNEHDALKNLSKFEGLCFTPKIDIEFTKSEHYPIYYFGTEYFEGETLRSKIDSDPPPWPWEKCIETTHQIAVALGGCSISYVHRDLHPGNILITDTLKFNKNDYYVDPGIRILDYGCSKDNVKFLYYGTLNEDKFRHVGAISSWSPEFLLNPELVDQNHDSWAIGVILYNLLSGKYPAQASNFGELIHIYQGQDINLELPVKTIPITVYRLLQNLLSFTPTERFSCGAIASTCGAILYTDLNSQPDHIVDMFFEGRGGIYKCIRCDNYIGKYQPKCNLCGQIIDDDGYVEVLGRK